MFVKAAIAAAIGVPLSLDANAQSWALRFLWLLVGVAAAVHVVVFIAVFVRGHLRRNTEDAIGDTAHAALPWPLGVRAELRVSHHGVNSRRGNCIGDHPGTEGRDRFDRRLRADPRGAAVRLLAHGTCAPSPVTRHINDNSGFRSSHDRRGCVRPIPRGGSFSSSWHVPVASFSTSTCRLSSKQKVTFVGTGR